MPRKSKRRQTAHLKLVPQDKSLRESLKSRAAEVTAKLDKSRPLAKDEMEALARRTLEEAGQPEGYTGWRWNANSPFGDRADWEEFYVAGYRGYTCAAAEAKVSDRTPR